MELSMSALENAEHDEGLAIDVISSTAIIATKDPLDPLNWSFVKKWACILIACLSYFTQLYFTTVIIPCFGLLQAQLHATYNQVNWIFGVSALGMAAGPLLTASIADTYGRRIVLIFSTMIALVSCGCTSLHNISFSGYMAARFFLGLGAGPSANISLSIINDVSFEHERGFRVGLWAVSANVGSFAGAVVGGFIALVSQYWATYHLTIFFAFTLTCQCLFLPETNYPRAAVLEHEYRARERKDNSRDMEEISLKRTRQLGYLHWGKIPGVLHPKPYDAILEFCRIWAYPTVSFSACCFLFFQYWWVVSIMNMVPEAYSTYSPDIQGLMFIGLIVGVVFAEFALSGHVSDRLVARLARGNGGRRTPEMRLWLGYPAAIVSSVGLIVWGFSIERKWHWMTGQVGFFIYAAGMQVGNMVLTAYIVDNYPEHAMRVIMFYSVVINISAFINPWFISIWIEKSGWIWTFCAQAICCTFGLIPGYAALHIYGPRLRKDMPPIIGGKT